MRIVLLAFSVLIATLTARAQYAVGIQGGPLFFSGVDPKAWAELSNTSGWTAGLQVLQGRRGESGFRVGLDVGQRRYGLYANNEILRARYDMVSTLCWISFEMRWSLSRRHRIFFELGPVIGVELREERTGYSSPTSTTGVQPAGRKCPTPGWRPMT